MFLAHPSLFSCPPLLVFLHYLPPSLISSCLNLALWNSGKVKEFEHALSNSVLSDPMDCSTPGLPVHHQHPEFTQTHVHRVGDTIQPSHPLSSPSPHLQSFPASGFFQMSQVFTSGGQSIGVSPSASVLPMNIQD